MSDSSMREPRPLGSAAGSGGGRAGGGRTGSRLTVGAPALAFRAAAPVAPLQHLALWLAELAGWRRLGLAWLLGALAAAALPPVDLVPVLVVSFTGLVWLADGDRRPLDAFLLGWAFGFGFFVAGLYWIAAALLIDIAAFWWLMPAAALGVPAMLGIFTGAALLASFALRRQLRLTGSGRILALVIAWSAAEWLRGHILTGFPWNLVGYAWSGGFPGGLAMLQTAAATGIYGLSLITVLAATLPATLGDLGRRSVLPLLAAALLVAGPMAAGAWRLATGSPGNVPGVTLRLVQPSIVQELKNDPQAMLANFQRHMALSAAAGDPRPVTDIIWPESGAPPFLDRDAALRSAMASVVPPGGLLIVGTIRTEAPPQPPRDYWNSLEALDGSGTVVASYDKTHLVPFGEYVPLRHILPIDKISPGVDLTAGTQLHTLTLPGLPPVGPLICYEAIFPGAVVDRAHRPAWLLNLTNDAWYGFTSGPFQHFDIARVRAVEEGLPLVRSANNGISGVVDPYGRVTSRLGLDDVAYLDAALPQPLPPTWYARFRDGGFAALLLACLAAACAAARAPGRRAQVR